MCGERLFDFSCGIFLTDLGVVYAEAEAVIVSAKQILKEDSPSRIESVVQDLANP